MRKLLARALGQLRVLERCAAQWGGCKKFSKQSIGSDFEEILCGKIRKLIREMLKNHKIKLQKLEGLKDLNIFLEFHTLTVVNGLKYWLTSREVHMSADEALEYYRFLMSHPILDVVGQVEDYTEEAAWKEKG